MNLNIVEAYFTLRLRRYFEPSATKRVRIAGNSDGRRMTLAFGMPGTSAPSITRSRPSHRPCPVNCTDDGPPPSAGVRSRYSVIVSPLTWYLPTCEGVGVCEPGVSDTA